MEMVKAYRPEARSISNGQVLQSAYTVDRARVVVLEMADNISLELVENRMVTDQIVLTVGYDVESLTNPEIRSRYDGRVKNDYYGRKVPVHSHGTINLEYPSSSGTILSEKIGRLYDRIVNPVLLVRRLTLVINHLQSEDEVRKKPRVIQHDLFSDYEEVKRQQQELTAELVRERRRQEAVLKIKKTFGKNAILKGLNFMEGATQRDRNKQIGGHHE